MRGSPLVRFILLALALMVTAVGLARVTAARGVETSPVPVASAEKQAVARNSTPFRLVLSAPAVAVELDSGKAVHPKLDEPVISGTLEIDPANPHVALVVRWKNTASPDEHRFAKLTIEAPGQETLTHVFDADGDIDDILELPLPEKP